MPFDVLQMNPHNVKLNLVHDPECCYFVCNIPISCSLRVTTMNIVRSAAGNFELIRKI